MARLLRSTSDHDREQLYAGFRPYRGQRTVARQPNAPKAAPFGAVIRSISLDDLESMVPHASNAEITDCKLLGGYNWLDKQIPTIAIPGMPPKWSPLSQPQSLKEDSGPYYRDPNAAKYPAHPLEPAVVALMQTKPRASDKIDIFGCGSTLGNLLRFVRGDSKGFRTLVEVIGTTVHLIRREGSPQETIPDVRGYGHTFPDAYTNWDSPVRGSSSHQRIVYYCLGGMSVAVRFEGDGYLPNKVGNITIDNTAPSTESLPATEGTDISDLFTSSLAVSQTTTLETQPKLQSLTAGISIPQSAMFDLKTRSVKRKVDHQAIIAGELPRLWLRQIPNLIIAYHTRGSFDDIQVQDVRVEMKEWELKNKHHISSLISLLHTIIGVAKSRNDGKLEVTLDGADENLVLREQMSDAPVTFSEDVRQEWEEWLGGESSPEEDGSSGREPSQAGFAVEDHSDDEDYESDEYIGYRGYGELHWYDDKNENELSDYTACDKECGYCGRCDY